VDETERRAQSRMSLFAIVFLHVAYIVFQVKDCIRVTCGDGSAFIKQVVRESWDDPFYDLGEPKSVNQRAREARQRSSGSISTPSKGSRRISHFVMNLPDSAITFLSAFRGLFTEIRNDPDFEIVYPQNPMVHCYCFTRELEPERAETDIREVSAFILWLRSSKW
jgi:tRNA (guanine37-N1)-methyltransferase